VRSRQRVRGRHGWWRQAAPVVLAAALAAACSEGGPARLSEAGERGQALYTSLCIACHNPDPARDGSLGPAIAGSSRELLEARVVRGDYPPGYQPKRSSRAMPAFPHLAPQIDDLHAYLTECCGGAPDRASDGAPREPDAS